MKKVLIVIGVVMLAISAAVTPLSTGTTHAQTVAVATRPAFSPAIHPKIAPDFCYNPLNWFVDTVNTLTGGGWNVGVDNVHCDASWGYDQPHFNVRMNGPRGAYDNYHGFYEQNGTDPYVRVYNSAGGQSSDYYVDNYIRDLGTTNKAEIASAMSDDIAIDMVAESGATAIDIGALAADLAPLVLLLLA